LIAALNLVQLATAVVTLAGAVLTLVTLLSGRRRRGADPDRAESGANPDQEIR
jgi:hypothetical protein